MAQSRARTAAIKTQLSRLASEDLTQQQMGELIGISRRSVVRHLKALAPALVETEQSLQEYQACTIKELPHAHVAGRLREMVDQTDQWMAVAKGIEMRDRILGLTTAEGEGKQAPAALFSLPEGSLVMVKVGGEPQGIAVQSEHEKSG